MNKSAYSIVCLLCLLGCQVQERVVYMPYPYIPSDHVLMGELRCPLGSFLKIEGIRSDSDGRKRGTQTLLVDTVNGIKLHEPIEVWIQNTQCLPVGKRCVFNGYETGKMTGTPQGVADAEKHISPSAVLFHFRKYFMVTSIIEPKELEIRKEFYLNQ